MWASKTVLHHKQRPSWSLPRELSWGKVGPKLSQKAQNIESSRWNVTRMYDVSKYGLAGVSHTTSVEVPKELVKIPAVWNLMTFKTLQCWQPYSVLLHCALCTMPTYCQYEFVRYNKNDQKHPKLKNAALSLKLLGGANLSFRHKPTLFHYVYLLCFQEPLCSDWEFPSDNIVESEFSFGRQWWSSPFWTTEVLCLHFWVKLMNCRNRGHFQSAALNLWDVDCVVYEYLRSCKHLHKFQMHFACPVHVFDPSCVSRNQTHIFLKWW